MNPQPDRCSVAEMDTFDCKTPVEALRLLLPEPESQPDANEVPAVEEILERNEIRLNLRHWGINE
jgi:hypothetical protein